MVDKARLLQFGLVLVIGCVVGLTAIWIRDVPASVDSAAARQTSGTDDRPKMQDFTLPDLQGKQITFSAFAAGRPFVVTFGQTTCPPCVYQSHVFKQIHEKYGEKVALLKVYISEPQWLAARQVKQLKSTTKTLLDYPAEVYSRFGVYTVPVTVVGDAQGGIMVVGGLIPQPDPSKLLARALSADRPST